MKACRDREGLKTLPHSPSDAKPVVNDVEDEEMKTSKEKRQANFMAVIADTPNIPKQRDRVRVHVRAGEFHRKPFSRAPMLTRQFWSALSSKKRLLGSLT